MRDDQQMQIALREIEISYAHWFAVGPEAYVAFALMQTCLKINVQNQGMRRVVQERATRPASDALRSDKFADL